MSVYRIFILLVFNRECMERRVMTSFRMLPSLECFLRYFQTEWSVFFTLQCELFPSCNVSNNASLVFARTGGGGCQPNVDRPGQDEGGLKNSQICADILYGWPFMCWIKVSYHVVKSGFHRHSGSRDIMIFVCVVTLQGYAIKVLCDFMFWSPSRYVTTLTKSGGHRHCGSGDI